MTNLEVVGSNPTRTMHVKKPRLVSGAFFIVQRSNCSKEAKGAHIDGVY